MPDFYSIRVNPLEDVANQCTIVIIDTDSANPINVELALLAAGDPLQFKIIDNSEDPFTVIKSTQATIRFISTALTNSNTFSSGADERWFVIVLRGDLTTSPLTPIFRGYLVLNDIREDFMPIGNVVTLTATDGLGLLKEIPLQIPPPGPVTMERGTLDTNGHWSSNSSILNGSIEIDIYKRNLDGTPIWWVPTLKTGDKITIVFTGDTTQRATYQIGDVIDNGDFFVFDNVILISGTDYAMGTGEQFSIYTDNPELNPKGPYKIIDYIHWCLTRANGSFSGIDSVFPPIINVVFNIKLAEWISDISVPNTDPQHLFETVYLDSKTFEDDIGTCINCYEVLQRILGEEAVIFQRNAQWWIVRIDEFNGITGTTGTVTGSEEVVNGDFSGGLANWVTLPDTNWSVSGGQLVHDPGPGENAIYQIGDLIAGAQYRCRMDVGGTVGTVTLKLDSGTNFTVNAGTSLDSIGTYSGRLVRVLLLATSDFDGTVDNVSIMRVSAGSVTTHGFFVTQFDQTGRFFANLGEKEYFKEIGKDAPYTIFFSKEQTTHTNDRPHHHVKETYNFETPLEIPSNKDFERGALIDASDPLAQTFQIDNWRFYKDIPPDTQDNTAFIRRVYNSFGVEVERYAAIGIASNALYYLESEPIPVGSKDRFDFSVDIRWSGEVFGGGLNRVSVAQIRFFATNGTFWNLDGGTSIQPIPMWVESDSTWTTNQRFFVVEFDDVDDNDWKTASFWNGADCPPILTGLTGYITIVLIAIWTGVETHFANLRWEYIPFINGSYSKYSGQCNQVTIGGISDRFKAKRDQTVYMSDSPRPLFKGAMLKPFIIDPLDVFGLIFTDNTDFFSADRRINVPGDKTLVFHTGQQFQLTGTSFNNIVIHVLSAIYDSGTNTTDIIVSDTLIDESNASTHFYTPRFVLTSEAGADDSTMQASGFYDASLYPDGTGMVVRPFGQLQVYDVYNQFKAENKVFEGQMQGLDVAVTDVETLPGLAHLLYMWQFRDQDLNTNDRIFMLMTFDQSLRLEDWRGTFREVGNANRPKTYLGNVFKYISR